MDYRSLFPVTKDYIYLNHAANSPEPVPVVAAVRDYLSACSSQGTVMEEAWRPRATQTRTDFALLAGCRPADIAFLPNVSAAVNLVAGGLTWKPGDNVVVTLDQFPANVYPWMFLQAAGVDVRFADWQNHGFADAIRMAVDNRTRVVAVSWVEYFSGCRHNLADVGILCREQGIIYVIDAIQGLGVVPFPDDIGADLVAAGGQKWLLGPDGQGAAFFSPGLVDMLSPRAFSWRSIEDSMNFDSYRLNLKPGAERFEAGTQNWAGVIGFGAGLRLIQEVGLETIARKIESLTTRLLEKLHDLPVKVITPNDWGQRAGIVTFQPPGDAEEIRNQLLARGIVCSTRRGALRVSPHFYNTQEEIDFLGSALRSIFKEP